MSATRTKGFPPNKARIHIDRRTSVARRTKVEYTKPPGSWWWYLSAAYSFEELVTLLHCYFSVLPSPSPATLLRSTITFRRFLASTIRFIQLGSLSSPHPFASPSLHHLHNLLNPFTVTNNHHYIINLLQRQTSYIHWCVSKIGQVEFCK